MSEMIIRHVNNGFICSFDMYDEDDVLYEEEVLYEHKTDNKDDMALALHRVIIAMSRYFDIVDDKQYTAMKKKLEKIKRK
jgi:hypothetical protein